MIAVDRWYGKDGEGEKKRKRKDSAGKQELEAVGKGRFSGKGLVWSEEGICRSPPPTLTVCLKNIKSIQ